MTRQQREPVTPAAGRTLPRAGGSAVRGRPPLALMIPATAGLAFLVLPLLALLVRAPWTRVGQIAADPALATALGLSLRTAGVSTVLAVLAGVPLAWLLARVRPRGVALLRAVVTLPMVLPPVVGGVALLMLLGRRGLLGRVLEEWFGITLPFTTPAVVLAQTFVALPFLVLSVDGALRAADRTAEGVAATLGASQWTTFRRITLPGLLPAVGAGAVLCFARALGEFGATITFAGSFPGTTRTVPIEIYLALARDPDAAIALAVVLMLVCAVVLVVMRSRWLSGLSGLREPA